MRTAIACCIAAVAWGADAAPTMRTSLAETGVYDHRHAVDPGWTEGQLAAARALAVAVGHSPRDDLMVEVLREAAESDPRYELRYDKAPGMHWYRRGGLGAFKVGTSARPETRIEGFAERISKNDLAEHVAVGILSFSVDDISPGNEVEVAYEVYRARINVRQYSVALSDVTTDRITAQRNVGRGDGGGVVFTDSYPIELPTTSVNGVATGVMAPAGASTGTVSELKMRPTLHPRDARVAIRFYREMMGTLQAAYPETVWVWTTVPLEPRANYQRNSFNHYVREQIHAIPSDLRVDAPLYDQAAILSHDPDGVLQMDSQGPVTAPVYLDAEQELTPEARHRLAMAWWALLVDLAARS